MFCLNEIDQPKMPTRLRGKLETSREKLLSESDAIKVLSKMGTSEKSHEGILEELAKDVPKITFDYRFRFGKCGKCGHELLVETLLFGIDHTADIIVTCKDCLKKAPLPEEFIKEHPEEAKAIVEWLQKG